MFDKNSKIYLGENHCPFHWIHQTGAAARVAREFTLFYPVAQYFARLLDLRLVHFERVARATDAKVAVPFERSLEVEV